MKHLNVAAGQSGATTILVYAQLGNLICNDLCIIFNLCIAFHKVIACFECNILICIVTSNK